MRDNKHTKRLNEYLRKSMYNHMLQLRDRVMKGDYTSLDDFFSTYVFDDDIDFQQMEAGYFGKPEQDAVELAKKRDGIDI